MRALKRLFAKMTPASRLYFDTTNQTKTVDGGRASFLDKSPARTSRLRFAVPARIAHPRRRVSQARIRWAADCSILQDALRFSLLVLSSPTARPEYSRNLL